MKYFSYGSNMSVKRLNDRGVQTSTIEKGVLKGYRFSINKKSYKNPNIGFANIVKDENSIVEGVIYDIKIGDLTILDKFEGYPKHYKREIHKINDDNVIVYIANDKWVSEKELETTKEYKDYILEGKLFLSENYFQNLNELIKVVDSDVNCEKDD